MADVIAMPGIDVRRLRAGTIIFVEAEPYFYELTVMHPVHGVVAVNSNDPALRESPVGQVIQSRHESDTGPSMSCWIGKGLVMEIRFRNGTYRSPVVGSATLKGNHEDSTPWSYDVF